MAVPPLFITSLAADLCSSYSISAEYCIVFFVSDTLLRCFGTFSAPLPCWLWCFSFELSV